MIHTPGERNIYGKKSAIWPSKGNIGHCRNYLRNTQERGLAGDICILLNSLIWSLILVLSVIDLEELKSIHFGIFP